MVITKLRENENITYTVIINTYSTLLLIENNNPTTFTTDLFLDDLSKNGRDTKMNISVVSNYSSTLVSPTGSHSGAIKPSKGGLGPYQAVKPDANIMTKPNSQ